MTNDRPETDSRGLTWAALLGKWTEFARASVAFPNDETGRRWKDSVSPVIALQAVTMALREVDLIRDPEERAAALDRAEIVIRREIGVLHEIWSTNGLKEPLPDQLVELSEDAWSALHAAHGGGIEWIVQDERLIAPDPTEHARRLIDAGTAADFFAAKPGTVLFRGEPLAFLQTGDTDISFQGCQPRRTPHPHQVYRQIESSSGRVAGDVVVRFEASLPPGMPLLMPVLERGRLLGSFDPDEAARWEAAQRAALGDQAIPVKWEDDDPFSSGSAEQ